MKLDKERSKKAIIESISALRLEGVGMEDVLKAEREKTQRLKDLVRAHEANLAAKGNQDSGEIKLKEKLKKEDRIRSRSRDKKKSKKEKKSKKDKKSKKEKSKQNKIHSLYKI